MSKERMAVSLRLQRQKWTGGILHPSCRDKSYMRYTPSVCPPVGVRLSIRPSVYIP